MERKDFHIGPGAASLILVAVVVSMAVLGLLAVLDVRSDTKLTDRSTAMVEAQYGASAQAERDLAELDAVLLSAHREAQDDETFLSLVEERLPEYMTLDGDQVSWEREAGESSVLSCTVTVRNTGASDRVTWTKHLFESNVGAADMDF